MLKTGRNSIEEHVIQQAIINVFSVTCLVRASARVHGVKRSTLQSRVTNILSNTTKESYLRKTLKNPNDSGNDSQQDDNFSKYSRKYTNIQGFSTEK